MDSLCVFCSGTSDLRNCRVAPSVLGMVCRLCRESGMHLISRKLFASQPASGKVSQ